MNVGANTMTLAARDIGMTIIPEGKCTFPPRIIRDYQPTAIVGSIFKRLVIGGESFAEVSRAYLAELWDCGVYNSYGSTEGTMCGECTEINGLHVPEDLVHLDIYDPQMKDFVQDGECGRGVFPARKYGIPYRGI